MNPSITARAPIIGSSVIDNSPLIGTDVIIAAPVARIAFDDRRAWWAALLLICTVLIVPLFLVDVPPLLDYPNHLARMVLLAWPNDPALSRLAEPHWAIIPDLAIDIVLPPMLHVLPVHVAGRVAVACIVLLPVAGTIAYSSAIFGKPSWWALAVGLIAYNGPVLLGFLNFTASIGLALLLAAAWIRWRDAWPRCITVVMAAGASMVFFCHLMGVVFLAILLASFEASEISRKDPLALWHALRRAAVLAAVFLPVAILYAISPLSGAGGLFGYLPLYGKAQQLLVPFINYSLILDLITAVAVVVFLAWVLLARRCRTKAGSAIAVAASLLLFAAAPAAAKGGHNIDMRFALMFALLLFAGFLPLSLPRPLAAAAAACMTGLFAARMAVLALAWHASALDITQLRQVIAPVPPGSTVFVTSVSPDEAPDYWRNAPLWRRLSNGLRVEPQMPALLLIEHHAFWPFLFDNPSQQPIVQQPAYRALAQRVDAMPDHRAFATPGAVDLCGFDYVLLLDAGGEPDLAHFGADRLALLTQADFAALYRVVPQPRKCGGS